MSVHRRNIRRRETSNVDVTAFLSLMVILVPFLLITAVFSRITILELEGSAKENTRSSPDSGLQLRVVVRQDSIEVSHRGQKQSVRLARTAEGTELESLTKLLTELKERAPQSSEATILVEPQIPYDLLIQVMDAVRVKQLSDAAPIRNVELFPNIALGSASGSKRQ